MLADLKIAAYTTQAQQVSSRLLTLYNNKKDNNYEYYNELLLIQGLRTPSTSTSSTSSTIATTTNNSTTTPSDPLQYFYQCLADNQDTYRRSTTTNASISTLDSSSITSNSIIESSLLHTSNTKANHIINSFTNDELYGKYIDIQNTIYDEFINLPGIREIISSSSSSSTSSSTSASTTPTVEYSYFKNMNYIQYLKRLTELHGNIPYKTKITRPYRRYLIHLVTYLSIFFQKRYPLVNMNELLTQWYNEFIQIFQHNQLPGWKAPSSSTTTSTSVPSSTNTTTTTTNATSLLDLNKFTSENELLTNIDNETCKQQLRLRGLKLGGTDKERINRLWLVRNLTPDQYPKKLLATGTNTAVPSSSDVPAVSSESSYTLSTENTNITTELTTTDDNNDISLSSVNLPFNYIDVIQFGSQKLGGNNPLQSIPTAAWCEVVITHFLALLNDIIKETRRRIEKRQTKTYEEIIMEREAEYAEVTKSSSTTTKNDATTTGKTDNDNDDDDDDEDTPIYNPLNIPLGWDGKPIPYWLYKLHGLNIEYTCEICGNEKYKGRKNFDHHFQEAKHAYGMRCLGIPNTKHFHDITKIADAKKCKYLV